MPTSPFDTPGHAAYHTWKEVVPLGMSYPLWRELPEAARNGWEDIARAAVRQWEQRSELSMWSPYE